MFLVPEVVVLTSLIICLKPGSKPLFFISYITRKRIMSHIFFCNMTHDIFHIESVGFIVSFFGSCVFETNWRLFSI